MDNLAISEVFQDKNNNVYIDFESEFQHLRKVNIELAQEHADLHISNNSYFEDPNKRVVDVSSIDK